MSSPQSRRNFLKSSAMGFGAGLLASAPLVEGQIAHASTLRQGTGKLQEVLSRGTLLVGTGSTNPPWHFEDESGNLVGFDIEMARIVAKGLFGDPTKVEFTREA